MGAIEKWKRLTMDNTFRNSLSVKVGEQVDQVKVLQEQGTVGSDSLNLCTEWRRFFSPNLKSETGDRDSRNVP